MLRRVFLLIGCLTLCALEPATVIAQEGHPLTGTWTGDWKLATGDSHHVTAALEWDGKNVTGTINPGPNGAQVKGATIDLATWTVHLDAEGKERIALDGRLSNIGLAARTLTGTWTEGAAKSAITLTRVDSMSTSSNSGTLPHAIIYDGPRVTIRGTVTNVEWINPRVRFAVREQGTGAAWIVEVTDGATSLERNGFNARTLKIGDAVTVQAVTATDAKSQALASSVALSKGGAQLFKLSLTTQWTYGPVPRWPDGQVQLGPPPGAKGYWKLGVPDQETPPNLKAGELAAMPWAKAVWAERGRRKFRDDPMARCVPPGGPRQFLGEQGFQFVDLRERILVLHGDGDRNWRIIYTDGRPQGTPADVVSSYYGSSVGHWDKDTLVVDSLGYNEKFWFMSGGPPHTEALHLTERFTRTDLSTLKYEVTVDDPRTYTKPWTINYTMRWVANQEIQEFFCEEKTP